jgi:hypothetical protein
MAGTMATKKKQKKAQGPIQARTKGIGEHAEAETQETGDGVESFSDAAEGQLRKLGDKIAQSLGEKAAEGDLNCTKFLVTTAKDKGRKSRLKKRNGLSEAQRLAAEPPWVDPEAEKTPEFGVEIPESEG